MEVLVEIARWLGLGLLAYAIGAIPTAYLFARFSLGRDIRSIGDSNSGAANVYREIGPKAGLACGALDIIKGGVAVIIVGVIANDTGIKMFGGVCAFVGHIFPIYLRFRGGRGAAVAVGVLIAMLPLFALPLGALALVALYHTRKSMVALFTFLAGVPVLSWVSVLTVGYDAALAGYALVVPIMAGLSHLYSTLLLPRFQKVPSPSGRGLG
ncbi:MAG: glycerol-3-phosphate acyltransferase [Chloroflexi bacterium]|nr:glycerol-3-phosphate acyltransferase [Chloroflexota bacterium]MYE40737.1 glycerol-3-phosphate acyltransferase [Chloroflexota bacterium]